MHTRIEGKLIFLTKKMARIKKRDSKQIFDLTEELLFDVIKYVHSTAKYLCGINLNKGLELIIRNTYEKEPIDQD